MNRRPFATTALAVAAMSVCWLSPPVDARTPGVGPDLQPVDEVGWREVLDRAVAASTGTAYRASMVVISLGEDGPGVTEVEVSKGADGDLSVSSAEAWLIAREDTSALYRDDEAGRLLRLSQVQSLPFTLPEVGRAYDIRVAGRATLKTGSAVGVAFSRDGVLRERLFVDDTTGLVVRRETYDMTGAPVRVTALTRVRVIDVDSAEAEASEPVAMGTDGTDVLGERTPLSPDEVHEIADHGWRVPTTVGAGFELRAGYAVDGGEAVQLVYSDGLYTLSVFEQPGHVDGDALGGAVHDEVDGIPVYRWPGAEPERMVWNGDGHTFTAVTDAPPDVLMGAVADLPHDTAPSVPTRMRRGLTRLGGWLWPFD